MKLFEKMNRLLLQVFFLMGFVSSTHAVQNLDTPTAPLVYASENNSTAITGAALNVTAVLQPNATPAGTDLSVQVNLSNGAAYSNAPTMANIGAESFPISTGGIGSSTVTFTGNSGAGGFAAGVTFSITMAGIHSLLCANHSRLLKSISQTRIQWYPWYRCFFLRVKS